MGGSSRGSAESRGRPADKAHAPGSGSGSGSGSPNCRLLVLLLGSASTRAYPHAPSSQLRIAPPPLPISRTLLRTSNRGILGPLALTSYMGLKMGSTSSMN